VNRDAYHCHKCDGVLDIREFNCGICDNCHKEHLTTEQLAQAALETVKQMSPEEKAKLRQQLDACRGYSGCAVNYFCKSCKIMLADCKVGQQYCDVCETLICTVTVRPWFCWAQMDYEAVLEHDKIKKRVLLGQFEEGMGEPDIDDEKT
jgi:hypothetical protein